MFVPSQLQEAVAAWVKNGRGHAVLNAKAGSGKTSTLIWLLQFIFGDVILVAFNKHIADELQRKVGTKATVKTVHGLGYGAIAKAIRPKRVNVQEHKYRDIAQTFYSEDRAAQNTFVKLIDLVRCTLTDVSNQEAVNLVIEHYGIEDVQPSMLANLPLALQNGRMFAAQGTIDYTDMLWIPAVENYSLASSYSFVLCDEAQDLSAAQLGIVLKAQAKGGRMLFVGDPNQSIYGFAGADCESFNNIKTTLDATELPLSICYRCPSSVLDLARQIVPDIQDRPNCPEGTVDNIPYAQLFEQAGEGDMILCRTTAPLISACIKMIRNKIPARVRGRDIAANLTGIVKKAAKMNSGVFDENALGMWADAETTKILRRKHNESALQAHQDKVAGILACWHAFATDTVAGFCSEIESLFSDGRASVLLSTVHRAKGLENPRVFILKPELLPLTWKNQRDWEYVQETNLNYVAITRATEHLTFVTSPPKGQEDAD